MFNEYVPCSVNHRWTRLGWATLASLQEFLFELSGKFISQYQLSNTLYVILWIFQTEQLSTNYFHFRRHFNNAPAINYFFFTKNYRQLWMCRTNTASCVIMIFITIMNVKRLFCFLLLEWFSFLHRSVYFDKQ